VLSGVAESAWAHGDYDARPSGELTGEAPEGASPEVVPVHGDYDWIRRGGYKGVDGSSCCGEEDCERVPAARIDRTPEGYRLHDFGITVPYRQTITSEDGQFWLCRDMDARKAMRCFFAPPPGS
jgi:hypothetical protein